MIVIVDGSYMFYGDNFSADHAVKVTGLPFVLKSETEYRRILMAPNRNVKQLLDLIEPHFATLRSLGADEINLYITYAYYEQCNFEFHDIKRIASLCDVFCISCYEVETEEEFRELQIEFNYQGDTVDRIDDE